MCEQTEDPAEAKKRGSKAVVRREIVRVVTPGTITEEALLEARSANCLAADRHCAAGRRRRWRSPMFPPAAFEVLRHPRLSALEDVLAAVGPREVLVADASCRQRRRRPAPCRASR